MKELVKQLKTIHEQITDVESQLNSFSAKTNREKKDVMSGFDRVFNEASKLTSSSELIRSVAVLYEQYLSLKDGVLVFQNKANENNGFYSPQQVGDFIKKFLYESFEVLKGKENIAERCKNLAMLHSDIMNLAQNKDAYVAEYLKQTFDKKDAEITRMSEELAALKEKSNKLSECLRIEKEKMPENPFIDSGSKCPKSYQERISIPVGIKKAEDAGLDGLFLQCEWQLNNQGILCVETDKEGMRSGSFENFIKSLLLSELLCYPAIGKRLLLCDRTCDERIISFAGQLSEKVGELFIGSDKSVAVERSESEITSSLQEISDTVSRRLVLIARSGESDILTYNAHNADNVQPLIFILLNGYPKGYSQAYETLFASLKNGKKAGVYFVLVTDRTAEIDDYTGRKLPETDAYNCMRIEFSAAGISDGDFIYDSDRLSPDFDISGILNELNKSISDENGSIPFLSVIPKAMESDNNFSKVLSIPLGKIGSKPFILNLDSTGDAHVIICGTTGSGKSSLLNTLILSASMLYTPEEVEIYLISITKSEFNVFSENGLPHLKAIITSDNVVGASDVLDYLSSVMQSRMDAIGSKSDIVMYNASVPKEKQIPRSLIVIDEYQRLIIDDKARDRLREIAELGRSCGISLILSSQSVPVEFRNALMLFRHRFEFRGSTVGDLIQGITHRQNELEGLNGLFFYGRGSETTLARLAYAGKDAELIKNIGEVKKRVGGKMQLVGELGELSIGDNSEIPFVSLGTERDYDENGICKIRLGKKYLVGSSIEFAFGYKNRLLCICGEYLLTKDIEAAIIKDVLYLSRKEDCRTLFYIDLNRNPNWSRRPTTVKKQRDLWTLGAGGRFAYYGVNQANDAFDEIESLIADREEDETASICPVVVIVTCVDLIPPDSDEEYRLCSLIDKGKNSNIFFALQFNEFDRRLNEVCRKIDIMENAIIVPDRKIDGEQYSSANLVAFLEQTVAATSSAKEMCNTFVKSPLDHRLNIICNYGEATTFTPYQYKPEFFEKLLKE